MIKFKDRPDFTPYYTPAQMFTHGIFGGAYFKIPTKLPAQFKKDIKDLPPQDGEFDVSKNKYKVSASNSLEWWQDKNLMHEDDPNGWVEWYIKFYYGRRHEDDDRQIKRFRSFVIRQYAMLKALNKKGSDSEKIKQNLLHWAWNYKIEPNFNF